MVADRIIRCGKRRDSLSMINLLHKTQDETSVRNFFFIDFDLQLRKNRNDIIRVVSGPTFTRFLIISTYNYTSELLEFEMSSPTLTKYRASFYVRE